MALSLYASSGARKAAAAIVCAAAAFASVAPGYVAQSTAAAAAGAAGGGLLADVLSVDEDRGANRTYRYATLRELVNCSSRSSSSGGGGGGGGGGAFVLLRTPSWQPDYSACLPALTRLREDAESLRRGEGDAALRAAAAAAAAAVVARVPDGAASVSRKLFELAPVKEVALTANAGSGSGRAVLWRRGGADDAAVQAPEAVDWNSTLAATMHFRRPAVTAYGLASGNASSEWSEPLYDCAAGEWFTVLTVQQQSQPTEQEETTTGDGVINDGRWQLFIIVSLQKCDINQCQTSGLLAGTHLCDPAYTICESGSGSGFATGAYTCKCKSCAHCPVVMGSEAEAVYSGYLHSAPDSGSGRAIGEYFAKACSAERNANDSIMSSPLPGHEGVGVDGELVRGALLVTSGACVVFCWIFMIVVMARRDNKAIMSAKWIVLEMVLIGSTLLYGSVMVEYFPPATWSCLLRPWMRELGFGCTYGALNIKTYKVLAEFRTRKARRVHVRDKDLVKYWLLVLVVMTFYMASWTATTLRFMSFGSSDGGYGDLIQWPAICVNSAWNIVTELMELLFVATGLYMSYRIRRAPSLFWESKFVAVIFSIECLVSGAYYVVRHGVLLSLGQDWAYVASFCRTQATVSLLLLLLLGPKLWYAFHPPGKGSPWSREGAGAELFGFGANINGHRGGGGPGGGDSEVVDISLKEMEPEEIWRELRRVYTQLQLLKVKVMRYENPHIHEKKHHRIRKQLYSRISRSGHNHKGRPDAGCSQAADEDFACSHEQELLAYEGGQPTAAAAPASNAH